MNGTEKLYTVSKCNAIKQLLDHLCTKLTEHKWKDALTILPAVLLQINDRHCQFIWKAIHIIMIHMQVSQDKRITILQLMFKSELKSYPIVLEWFTEALQSADHTCIENYFQFMKHDLVHKKLESYPAAIFDAYMALFFYMQWITKYNELTKSSTNEDPSAFGQSLEEKAHLDLGVRIFDKLNRSYAYFGKCNICGDQAPNRDSTAISNNKNISSMDSTAISNNENISSMDSTAISNNENISSMCEWLLAPLLDLEEKLNRSQEGNEDLVRRFGPSLLSGLEILEQYCSTRQDQLPSLKLLYLYISKFHSKDESKKLSALRSICILCPEEYLVLTYVEGLLHQELGDLQVDSFSVVNSSDDIVDKLQSLRVLTSQKYVSECLLSGKRISILNECVDMLTSFLEYLQWHMSIKAWHLLATILRIFQSSWTNCWNCQKCIKSRKFIEKHCLKLALWPEIFWNFSQTSNSLNEKERILLIYKAYSAFLFGYNSDIEQEVDVIFQNQGNKKLSKEVRNFFKLRGQYSDTFVSYIKEEKSKRFLNADLCFTQHLKLTSDEDLKRKNETIDGSPVKKRKKSVNANKIDSSTLPS